MPEGSIFPALSISLRYLNLITDGKIEKMVDCKFKNFPTFPPPGISIRDQRLIQSATDLQSFEFLKQIFALNTH